MPEIKLINSRFTKVSASRNTDFSGKVTTKTNIKILDLKNIENSKNSLQVKYLFEINYAELGQISLEGMIFLLIDAKTIKELLKLWGNKKIDSPEFIIITNIIIQKASVKALELEDELGLPFHIRLPKIDLKSK